MSLVSGRTRSMGLTNPYHANPDVDRGQVALFMEKKLVPERRPRETRRGREGAHTSE